MKSSTTGIFDRHRLRGDVRHPLAEIEPISLNGHLKSGHLWSLQKRPFKRDRVR